jgi:hypothetical protein
MTHFPLASHPCILSGRRGDYPAPSYITCTGVNRVSIVPSPAGPRRWPHARRSRRSHRDGEGISAETPTTPVSPDTPPASTACPSSRRRVGPLLLFPHAQTVPSL